MHSELLLVVVILIVGCAAFLFGVVYVICSAIAFVGRQFIALFAPPRQRRPHARLAVTALICPQPTCRKVEYRRARFCSRCGSALVEQAIIDSHPRPAAG